MAVLADHCVCVCVCVCVVGAGGGGCYRCINLEGCVHPSKNHYEVNNQWDYNRQSNVRILKCKVKTVVLCNGT